MKHALAVLLFLGLFTSAWAGAQKGQPIKTTGTIKHQGLEGGFWGIVGDDGQNYDPANLAAEFQKEDLRVSFEAVPSSNQMSFHMWGTIVEIKSMKKLGRTGSPLDTLHATTGVAQADFGATWEVTKKVLAARGETILSEDKTVGTLSTKPRGLDKDALLAAHKSRFKPEDSGYREGTYDLLINLVPKWKSKTQVEIRAKIMAFGTENKALAKPDTWDPVPSNGKIEKEVLKAILSEAKKRK
jgi:hypothetical protein